MPPLLSIAADQDLSGQAPPRSGIHDAWRLWAVILLVSPTSELLARAALGVVPWWLIVVRMMALAALITSAAYVRSLRILRPFCIAYLIQLAVVAAAQAARSSPLYRLAASAGFVHSELFLAGVVFLVIAPAIAWCWPRRDRFFLRVGDPTVPVARLKLRWRIAAPVFGVVSAVCAWAFVAFTGAPLGLSAAMAAGAIVLAAVNAFQEEFLNRNLLIGAVEPSFGPVHAVLVGAFIFGIGHWNGLPAGVMGVLMTFALGAATGTAMVQTRGMFCSWLMHFIPDCVLFYAWGVGSVAHATIGSGR